MSGWRIIRDRPPSLTSTGRDFANAFGVATLRRLEKPEVSRSCSVRGRQSKLPGRRYGCDRSISPRSLLMAAATVPLPTADSTVADPTVNFSAARFAFRQLESWLTSDETAAVSA